MVVCHPTVYTLLYCSLPVPASKSVEFASHCKDVQSVYTGQVDELRSHVLAGQLDMPHVYTTSMDVQWMRSLYNLADKDTTCMVAMLWLPVYGARIWRPYMAPALGICVYGRRLPVYGRHAVAVYWQQTVPQCVTQCSAAR